MRYLFLFALSFLLAGAGCLTTTTDVSVTEEEEEIEAEDEGVMEEEAEDEDEAEDADVEEGTDDDDDETTETATISMTAEGFVPSTVTVETGTTVTFVNNDSAPHWPASAFHPTHLELPGFDSLEGVAAGASYSFTFTEVGTWKFHDHLNPSLFGSVTVE